MRPIVVVMALLISLCGGAVAQEPVLGVADATTLRLASGLVRLAGLRVPQPLPGQGGTGPEAEAARQVLAELVEGRRVTPVGTPARDRHGRQLAQMVRDDGLWLQGEMVRRGLVMAWPRRDARDRAGELLLLEAEARAAGRGLWARRQIDDAAAVRPNRFGIVEGRVAATRRVRGRIYLNFGADWRSDFTVAIEAADLAAFKAAGLDPMRLEGRRVRVRGWIENFNGPYIEVDHPERIEVLDGVPEPVGKSKG